MKTFEKFLRTFLKYVACVVCISCIVALLKYGLHFSLIALFISLVLFFPKQMKVAFVPRFLLKSKDDNPHVLYGWGYYVILGFVVLYLIGRIGYLLGAENLELNLSMHICYTIWCGICGIILLVFALIMLVILYHFFMWIISLRDREMRRMARKSMKNGGKNFGIFIVKLLLIVLGIVITIALLLLVIRFYHPEWFTF